SQGEEHAITTDLDLPGWGPVPDGRPPGATRMGPGAAAGAPRAGGAAEGDEHPAAAAAARRRGADEGAGRPAADRLDDPAAAGVDPDDAARAAGRSTAHGRRPEIG